VAAFGYCVSDLGCDMLTDIMGSTSIISIIEYRDNRLLTYISNYNYDILLQ